MLSRAMTRILTSQHKLERTVQWRIKAVMYKLPPPPGVNHSKPYAPLKGLSLRTTETQKTNTPLQNC